MITFERTQDYALIREIMTHPKIYPYIIDDGCPPVEGFQPQENDAIYYVAVKDEGEMMGIWMLVPHNTVCFEVHTCLLPSAWGRKSRDAAAQFMRWIWENIKLCNRIITNVPAYNRIALRFARDCGMTEFGINQNSFLKNGTIYDQVMLGVTRPEGV